MTSWTTLLLFLQFFKLWRLSVAIRAEANSMLLFKKKSNKSDCFGVSPIWILKIDFIFVLLLSRKSTVQDYPTEKTKTPWNLTCWNLILVSIIKHANDQGIWLESVGKKRKVIQCRLLLNLIVHLQWNECCLLHLADQEKFNFQRDQWLCVQLQNSTRNRNFHIFTNCHHLKRIWFCYLRFDKDLHRFFRILSITVQSIPFISDFQFFRINSPLKQYKHILHHIAFLLDRTPNETIQINADLFSTTSRSFRDSRKHKNGINSVKMAIRFL